MISAPPNPRPSVLVVDDEPDLREMLALGLELEGFTVATAEGGEAAVSLLRRQPFDLVLTDLKMPGMDGVATLAALKEIDPDLEVLILTGYGSVETAIDCLRLGAHDYLTKPCEMSELVAALKRAWAHRQAEPLAPLDALGRTLLVTPGDQVAATAVALAEKVVTADAVGLLQSAGTASERWSWSGPSVPPEAPVRARLLAAARGAAGPSVVELDEASGFTHALACPLSLADSDSVVGTIFFLRGPEESRFTRNDERRAALLATLLVLVLERPASG